MDFFTHEQIANFIYIMLAFLFSVSVHEFCHALVATLRGDDLPRLDGRVTLNPLAHFDFFGFLLIFLIGIGMAKPVRINPYAFKYPKLDNVLVSLAGPFANILMAFFTILCFKYNLISFISYEPLRITLQELATIFIDINIMLAVFNLIPIPGFDGFSVIETLAPASWEQPLFFIKQYSLVWVILLFWLPGVLPFFYHVIGLVKMLLLSVVF